MLFGSLESRGFASEVAQCNLHSTKDSMHYSLCTLQCALCTMQKVLSLQVWEGGDGQGLRFACQAYLASSPPISWISETDDGCFGKFLIGTRVDAGRAPRPRRKEKRQIKYQVVLKFPGHNLAFWGGEGWTKFHINQSSQLICLFFSCCFFPVQIKQYIAQLRQIMPKFVVLHEANSGPNS